MRQEVIKARDDEIYTFVAKGGSYQAAAAKWNLKTRRIHEIVRGVAQTTRLARQETAIDKMLEQLDDVISDCLTIGTSAAFQAMIRAQDQKAKLLGLYGKEEREAKQQSQDEFSAWDYIETGTDTESGS